eukprot:7064064-Pyramimonas_sp.AAC.1
MPSPQNWMDVWNVARYRLLTKSAGGGQARNADNRVCVWDNLTTRDYMRVDTTSVSLPRLPTRDNLVRGPVRHMVDVLVIPRRRPIVPADLGLS